MRVISGERRGLNLFTLEGNNTRPTLDRVKETMFNVINFDLVGKNCLDVFSGSGSLSIEAISRGAEVSYLIEHEKEAFSIINKNVAKARYESKVKLYNKDYLVALKNIADTGVKFSIVFLDPPYRSDFYEKTLEALIKYNMLNEDAIIVMEHLQSIEIKSENYYIWKQKTFSKNAITFLKLEMSQNE